MQGLMMNRPLRVNEILTFAAEVHGDSEVVSVTVEGGTHRTTYRAIEKRTRQLANALTKLGVAQGDRVATLAWNCLLYTSPSPRDKRQSRMPSSA